MCLVGADKLHKDRKKRIWIRDKKKSKKKREKKKKLTEASRPPKNSESARLSCFDFVYVCLADLESNLYFPFTTNVVIIKYSSWTDSWEWQPKATAADSNLDYFYLCSADSVWVSLSFLMFFEIESKLLLTTVLWWLRGYAIIKFQNHNCNCQQICSTYNLLLFLPPTQFLSSSNFEWNSSSA